MSDSDRKLLASGGKDLADWAVWHLEVFGYAILGKFNSEALRAEERRGEWTDLVRWDRTRAQVAMETLNGEPIPDRMCLASW